MSAVFFRTDERHEISGRGSTNNPKRSKNIPKWEICTNFVYNVLAIII
jgi:hypothetical protein